MEEAGRLGLITPEAGPTAQEFCIDHCLGTDVPNGVMYLPRTSLVDDDAMYLVLDLTNDRDYTQSWS